MAYATRYDVFDLGLSAQAFVVRARPVESIDAATGVIRLAANGYYPGKDVVTLEVTSGGTLPTGLSSHLPYGVEALSADLFRLVDLNTLLPFTSFAEGGNGWSIAVDMMRRLDRHLEDGAAIIDQALAAHSAPLVAPYPVIVVQMNARLAARSMLPTLEFNNQQYVVTSDRLDASQAADDAQLQRWRAGEVLRPEPVDQTPEVADNGAFAVSTRPVVNWHTGRL